MCVFERECVIVLVRVSVCVQTDFFSSQIVLPWSSSSTASEGQINLRDSWRGDIRCVASNQKGEQINKQAAGLPLGKWVWEITRFSHDTPPLWVHTDINSPQLPHKHSRTHTFLRIFLFFTCWQIQQVGSRAYKVHFLCVEQKHYYLCISVFSQWLCWSVVHIGIQPRRRCWWVIDMLLGLFSLRGHPLWLGAASYAGCNRLLRHV